MQDETLTSPYGNGPADLPAQTTPEAQFMAQMGQVRIPQGPNAPSLIPPNEPTPVMPPESPDAALTKQVAPQVDFFADSPEGGAAFFDSGAEAEAPSVGKPTFGEMSSEFGMGEAIRRSVEDTAVRAKLSFARTDWEKARFLENIYGTENVRVKGGDVEFRRKGDKGFRKLDDKAIEYIDDAVDFARDAFEMGVEGVTRAGIGAGASLLGGPITGIGAAALSGAAGTSAAFLAGERYAEELGIPKDPKRSMPKELTQSAAIGALFGGVGAKISNWKAAKDLIKKGEENATSALATAKELEALSDDLAEAGINLKNGKMTLTPGQQASDFIPEGKMLDEQLSSSQPVRDFMEKQGAAFAKGWETLRHSIANATGKNADDLFVKAKEGAKLSTQLEGKLIEGFRDQALAVSKGAPRQMRATASTLEDLMFGQQGLGFRRVAGRDAVTYAPTVTVKGPSIQELRSMFGDASPKTIDDMNRILRGMEKKLRTGGGSLSLKDTDVIYKQLRGFIDSNMDTSGDKAAKSLINLKNQLRDDWTEHIGAELEQYGPSLAHGSVFPDMKGMTKIRPNAFQEYTDSLAKYSDMKKAQDTLANVLKKNDMSAAAFADYIFSPTQGKDRVKQMKTLLNDLTPELWDRLRESRLDRLTSDHIKKVKGSGAAMQEVIDFAGIRKDMMKLDRAGVLDELLAGGSMGKKELDKFMTLAERVDSSVKISPNALGSQETNTLMRRLFITLTPGTSMTAKVANVASLIAGMGKDKAVAKWLNGEGLEIVLKGVPPPKRSAIRSLINEVTKQALRTEIRMDMAAPDPSAAYQDIPAGGM